MQQCYSVEQLNALTTKLVMNQIEGQELPLTTLKLAQLALNDINDLQKIIDVGQFTMLLCAVSRLFFYAINEGVDENNRIEACDKAFDSGRVSVELDFLDKYLRSNGSEEVDKK